VLEICGCEKTATYSSALTNEAAGYTNLKVVQSGIAKGPGSPNPPDKT